MIEFMSPHPVSAQQRSAHPQRKRRRKKLVEREPISPITIAIMTIKKYIVDGPIRRICHHPCRLKIYILHHLLHP
jgi:hypothetical protein